MSELDYFSGFDLNNTVEKTPKMHGDAKEEQYPDVAPGWYRDCYICSKSYDEKYMVRKEYRRESTEGKGWTAVRIVHRYVISYCVWCHHTHVGS